MEQPNNTSRYDYWWFHNSLVSYVLMQKVFTSSCFYFQIKSPSDTFIAALELTTIHSLAERLNWWTDHYFYFVVWQGSYCKVWYSLKSYHKVLQILQHVTVMRSVKKVIWTCSILTKCSSTHDAGIKTWSLSLGSGLGIFRLNFGKKLFVTFSKPQKAIATSDTELDFFHRSCM